MTDMKYTDEQIVRALACCANNEKDNTCRYCRECPASNWELDDEECDCIHSMYTRSISIINRQKEEIERWQKFGYTVGELARDRKEEIGRLKKEKETARSEAIKEFAERLKAEMDTVARWQMHGDENEYFIIGKPLVDRIAKELTEGRQ